jgi:hypothetical protein
LDERAYRCNNRYLNDAERFSLAVAGIIGMRVASEKLIGRVTAADRNVSSTNLTGPWAPQTQATAKRDVLMCPSGGFSSLNLVFGNLIPCAPAVK